MLAQIGDALPQFRIYEQLFRSHALLTQALSEAYLDILQFCTLVKDFFTKAKRAPREYSFMI
jgi:hypothetical protein